MRKKIRVFLANIHPYTVRLPVCLLLALLGACDSGVQNLGSKGEQPHIFYEKDEFYVKYPKKAVFIAGGYTGENYSFTMRPIGAEVAIPKNHLVAVRHSFQPWAKEVYDFVSIVALLPNFTPRTMENSDSLMKSTSRDRLFIVIGGLSYDQSAREYHEAVNSGTLVLDTRLSSPDVPVYRKLLDTAGKEPFFALPDPSKFKSPLGNDIIIICPPKGYEPKNSQLPSGDCAVNIALPPSYFPSSSPEKFGGLPGVNIYYYFDEKYLPQWPELHIRLIDFLRGFAQQ